KEAVKYFLVWGGVQLLVQNTLNLAEYSDTRMPHPNTPLGYAEWAAAKRALHEEPKGEKLPAKGGILEESRRIENSQRLISDKHPGGFREADATAKLKLEALCRKYGIEYEPRHDIYLAPRYSLIPMRPRDEVAHQVGVGGESVIRMRVNYAKRGTIPELEEA